MSAAAAIDEANQPALTAPQPELSILTNASSDGPERRLSSSKREYRTTTQVSLKPKSNRTTQGDPAQESALHGIETGKIEDIARVFALQPIDTGFGAWGYVASAMCMFIVVWGFPQAFPIFQTYLTSGTLAKHRDSTVLALLAPGLQGILQGILFQVLPKRPRYHRTLVLVGISTIVLAMFLASCAVRPWQILLTQGVLFGMGAVLLNYVHVSIFPEWFDKKKGQAMGIIWLGWRVGGLGFPLISQWLLDRHGYEATVRSLIAPMVALLVPAIVLFRGRFSAASVEIAPVQPPLSTMRALQTPNVFFYLLVSILNESVTNVPTMFMMQYGADLGLSTSDQALSLSLRVLGMMVGTYVLSWLSDSISFEVLMVVSGVSTSLVHLLVWGFAKDRFGFFAYAVAVGLTSGGYYNCVVSFFTKVSGNDSNLFRAIHSLFSFFTGISILSVGPVGIAIIRRSPEVNIDAYAIGKYKYLVMYAGAMTMASGLLTLSRMRLKKLSTVAL